MKHFRKILIANRGEIAVRIINTAQQLGITCIALYTEGEENALHVKNANQKICLGTGTLNDTYLNIKKVVDIAKAQACDAIHPGYGFLSENAAFAKACETSKVCFIGPRSIVISHMGDKVQAKTIAKEAGVPVLEPVTGSIEAILEQAKTLEFPVLVKAAAGGGGKGMRRVENFEALHAALEGTSREAKSYFGDESVFVEKLINNPRHIEVQVLADEHGNAIHLFERECSWQRRHQKIIEEAPSPAINEDIRDQLGRAALSLVKTSGYTNVGTVEFILDEDLNFYFLEMNTRIQVEHPVTELITGVDIVEAQIRIAEGHPLPFTQNDIKPKGHAIECRIYAENVGNNFAPSPGYVHYYQKPSLHNCRLDGSIDEAGEISAQFDPMISKLVTSGKSRNSAILKMEHALEDYAIHGIHQNTGFLKSIISSERFLHNDINTKLLDEPDNDVLKNYIVTNRMIPPKVLVTAALVYDHHKSQAADNIWEYIGYWRHENIICFLIDEDTIVVNILRKNKDDIKCIINGEEVDIKILTKHSNKFEYLINGIHQKTFISVDNNGRYHITLDCETHIVDRKDNILNRSTEPGANASGDQLDGRIIAPMPGNVLQLYVEEGQSVERGEKLLVLEAMKMENVITAPGPGKVEKLFINQNDKVADGKILLTINLNKPD